ncbi:MAG: flavodoxin-dependent (E)-4-hydroxy-3-methylbut-2-enyl-diphosphate synthase [Tissierellia bacterium]|nr:flavodoxin-dependent (E)-4-hydroxy-3-methylbut-2-enyl-diphosphate synthase [Tissierellia bacterium]
MKRKMTKTVYVGNVPVGGGHPISIQSMTNTVTKDIDATINQINALSTIGCELIRFAVNDFEDAQAIPMIKKRISIPTIADIQFDHRLALAAVENGIDCLRINPGNIGARWKVQEVVEKCSAFGIPIRIGVNSGSIHQKFIERFHGVNVDSIVESALEEINILESMKFHDIKVSLKASNVNLCVDSYRKFSQVSDYPLHLGITEAGPPNSGAIKSAVGIGTLLSEGIGDTIRVSLTSDPMEEIFVAKEILKSLGLKKEGIDIVSCPTCARTKINLISMVEQAQAYLQHQQKDLTVALMGCAVNGPGEAREADIGIAGGNGMGIIFRKGKIIKKVREDQLLDELYREIEKL